MVLSMSRFVCHFVVRGLVRSLYVLAVWFVFNVFFLLCFSTLKVCTWSRSLSNSLIRVRTSIACSQLVAALRSTHVLMCKYTLDHFKPLPLVCAFGKPYNKVLTRVFTTEQIALSLVVFCKPDELNHLMWIEMVRVGFSFNNLLKKRSLKLFGATQGSAAFFFYVLL